MSLNCCHRLVRVRHREPRRLTLCQEYGDEVKADTILRDIMRGGIRTTHHESTTDPIHVLMLMCHFITSLLVAHGPLSPP